jgi:hypothetical protein
MARSSKGAVTKSSVPLVDAPTSAEVVANKFSQLLEQSKQPLSKQQLQSLVQYEVIPSDWTGKY